MAKIVMECPRCGKFVELKTGLFGKKDVVCDCGHVISVKTDRMASRECPHCGNIVLFDQVKGKNARCPVCGKDINSKDEKSHSVEVSCKQCGIRILVGKGEEVHRCPVCDFVNDVAERIKSEQIKKDGLASIIKYEGDDKTFVWKHPIEDFNLGSQLIVHESQEAVFFKDGQALDLFGAGRYTLETQQLPLLEKLYKLPTDTEGTFHSEVYFVNMATQMGIKWGTDSKVRLFDPGSGLHLEIGASGEFNIKVVDSRRLLLKVVGTTGGIGQLDLLGSNDNRGIFRALVITQVKSYLARVIRENAISILEIDEHLLELSDALRERINEGMAQYGLMMPEFYVKTVMTPDDDKNFQRMRQQYADSFLKVREEEIRKREAEAAFGRKEVEARTEAKMKVIGAEGEAEALKLTKAAEAEAYRMKAAAEAEELRMKGSGYQVESARQVALEAMQNGITGSESGGIGDVASLGIALGAMGGVMNVTKDAMAPVFATGNAAAGVANGGWTCTKCGASGITSAFCPNCGAARQQANAGDSWICTKCGTSGITSAFCPNCGAAKPEAGANPDGWTCPVCGKANIMSRFCPDCGVKKPEVHAATDGWTCPSCGLSGIKSAFCPNCGVGRPDVNSEGGLDNEDK